MSVPTTLFFNNPKKIYSVGTITFDLLLNESHSFNNQVTSYNVEDGSIINDHIKNELRTGSVSGLITNFSLYDDALVSNKAQDAFEKLKELWSKKELVTIVCVLDVYENVAITNIAVNRDSSTGEQLVADFSFQQINIVKLEQLVVETEVKLADMSSDQNKQSATNLNKGKQNVLVLRG